MRNLLQLFVASASLAISAETVIDIDFAKGTRPVNNAKVGVCRGVLPQNVNDNFSSWSEGQCETKLMTEDGRTFLRFAADSGKGVVQFSIPCLKLAPPSYFRITVEGRTRGNALGLGFRLNPAPYTTFSSHDFKSPGWKTESFLGMVNAKADASIGLYLYPSTGETDLCRLKVERVDRSALAAAIPRPPKDRVSFIDRRFPLGLPNGWNLDRDAETGTATAAQDAGLPVPVLRLASGEGEPFAVWSEPFQTSDPYTNHVVSFRCRGTGAWSAQVLTETRAWVKSTKIPVSSTWQDFSFTFRPQDLAKAFAVKFTGSGELFLDDLRVWYGAKMPPRPFPSALALGPSGGEIAADTRIFFADEKPVLAWAATGVPAGAVLSLSLTDLYGRTRPLKDIPLREGPFAKGTLELTQALDGLTGQFRVTGEVRAGGKAVSTPDEFVFTRIPRPVGWGRDLPDSPFGIHMEPRDAMIRAMKAGGINWTRLHDAALGCSGWWNLEKEKGVWTFRDAAIARFRSHHIKIFSQLGTAPAWATHYHDLGCKQMGYFEKFLRPVDTNAWLNYVTTFVKRYDGVIDEYFVWNEPWGRWWESAADIKYYDKSRAAEDFGEFQSLTYRAVKAVNPKILVSGFNTYAAKTGGEWSCGVAKGGGWETCDALDYHIYTPHLRATRGDSSFTEKAFAPLLAAHPSLDGKLVYMSEGQGTSTGSQKATRHMSGLYEKLVPWTAETPADMAANADATCRYTLSLLAEGNARIFLYTAHGYGGLVSPPNYITLVGADGFPYPSFAAYAVFTRALEGRRFVSKADHGAKGCLFEFRGSNGGVRLYTDLSPGEAAALHARTPLVDLYGNTFDPATWFPGTLLYAHDGVEP